MSLHANSALSYRKTTRYSQNLAVLDTYRASRDSLTDREVHARLGHMELVSVRRCITDMVTAKTLVEDGSKKCEKTGRTVRLVGLWQRHAQGELKMGRDYNEIR